jgi:hypothetical protein
MKGELKVNACIICGRKVQPTENWLRCHLRAASQVSIDGMDRLYLYYSRPGFRIGDAVGQERKAIAPSNTSIITGRVCTVRRGERAPDPRNYRANQAQLFAIDSKSLVML